MKSGLIVVAMMMLSGMSFATPTVSNLNAQQHSPLNGTVDLTFTVTGIGEGKSYEVVAVATNLANMAVLSVRSLRLSQDESSTSPIIITSDGTYNVIWDAAKDVDNMCIDRLKFCLGVQESHKAVQLWENGPYWAECNIGANNAWDCGHYFWWGDTVGYIWGNYTWSATDGSGKTILFKDEDANIQTNKKDDDTLLKEGWITSGGVLAKEHDAAYVNWGSVWRMPTKEEIDALTNNTTWTCITTNSVKGLLVCGKGAFEDKSIFFPIAGNGQQNALPNENDWGYYWSSTPSPNEYQPDQFVYAYCLKLNQYSDFKRNKNYRCYGQTIRPVREFDGTVIIDSVNAVNVELSIDTRQGTRVEVALVANKAVLVAIPFGNGSVNWQSVLDKSSLVANATVKVPAADGCYACYTLTNGSWALTEGTDTPTINVGDAIWVSNPEATTIALIGEISTEDVSITLSDGVNIVSFPVVEDVDLNKIQWQNRPSDEDRIETIDSSTGTANFYYYIENKWVEPSVNPNDPNAFKKIIKKGHGFAYCHNGEDIILKKSQITAQGEQDAGENE